MLKNKRSWGRRGQQVCHLYDDTSLNPSIFFHKTSLKRTKIYTKKANDHGKKIKDDKTGLNPVKN